MTAEEKAGGPPARCPENSALASCLDKLVRLETQANGDAFKIRAYKSAAMEIRALDYAITSGKLAAKAGKTKVKGVGKGLGEKIDEFLETGTMSRIAELEGQTDARRDEIPEDETRDARMRLDERARTTRRTTRTFFLSSRVFGFARRYLSKTIDAIDETRGV